MLFFKIIGFIFSHIAIGIILTSLVDVVAGDEPSAADLIGILCWPIALIALLFFGGAKVSSFFMKKMIAFWETVLPEDEE